ncbi:MAG: carbohydrate ABC transporter permease [Acholeplasmatales bacterium]|jgi:putative aldouronate transport system permease protein|nr:carbohydrate ABC transporter permease [Acholeplasmatales bacterium]
MKRLDATELIFKILSYVIITVFAIATIYPFVFVISSSISGKEIVEAGGIVLWPKDIQFDAVIALIKGTDSKKFWNSYTNTLFYTLYGTAFSLVLSIFAAYALSRTKLVFKKQISIFIVFTMWFSAGIIPSYLNYKDLLINNRWGIIFGFGVQAFNILLLRNYFNGISREIEEAAIIDGANHFQILFDVYVPMSKSSIATVTLFYALNRWNGYYWNRQLVKSDEHPLQVVLQGLIENARNSDYTPPSNYALNSYLYAAIVLSIIPILVVYPYLQKYFAKGVNVGGVKE